MSDDNECDYYTEFDGDKNTKLHHDAARTEISEVKKALETGKVKVDPENYLGWTPLMMAARNGNYEVVKLLIAHKADATKKNLYGSSVFLMAIASGNMDIIYFLLQHLLRGGVSKQSMEVILSPLIVALLFEQQPIINFLLVNSFNVNIAAPITGITPIMITAMQHNEALFQLLISKGADPFAKNINNQSAYEIITKKTKKISSSHQQQHKRQHSYHQQHSPYQQDSNHQQQDNHEQHTNQQQTSLHQQHNHHQQHVHLYPQHHHQPVFLSSPCQGKPVPIVYLSPSPNYFSPQPNNPAPFAKSSNTTTPPYFMLPSPSPIPQVLGHQMFFPQNFHPNTVLSPGNVYSPDNVFCNHQPHMSYHHVIPQMNE